MISKDFRNSVPSLLYEINGIELKTTVNFESVVSSILEGFGLLRIARRIFISYRRNESRLVAIQLFEKLEASGFDVFLDTHSVRPTDVFQEELWHRLTDTDVVVLLNTPGFLDSNWTKQELAKANSMSIGILQIVWPKHNLEDFAKLSIPYKLIINSFGNKLYSDKDSYPTETTLRKLISQVESLRARSLMARQSNITNEFINSAKKLKVKITLQANKLLVIKKNNTEQFLIIPTIGIPQAFTYNQSEELVNQIKSKKIKEIFLLFDHINIRKKWLDHLDWLDKYLPVRSIKFFEREKWLRNI